MAHGIIECIVLNENLLILILMFLTIFPSVRWTIDQHWFGYWIGTEEAAGHNLTQWWTGSLIKALLCPMELIRNSTQQLSCVEGWQSMLWVSMKERIVWLIPESFYQGFGSWRFQSSEILAPWRCYDVSNWSLWLCDELTDWNTF